MIEPELPELTSTLRTMAQQEQRARAELRDRDERFAVLEAEMWAGFEARERRHRELIDQREQDGARLRGELVARDREAVGLRGEIDRLQAEVHRLAETVALVTEDNFRLRVRLQRLLRSPPGRLYTNLLEVPGFTLVKSWRARRYEAAVARQRPV